MAIHHANSINTNTDDGHPQKRPKVDDGSTKPEQEAQLNSTAFSSRNLLSSLAPSLKLQHDQSIPYRHAVLRNMFDDNLLRLSRDEIRNNLSFTLKETDIYKVRSLLIPGNILKNLSKPCRLLFRTANTVTSKHLTGIPNRCVFVCSHYRPSRRISRSQIDQHFYLLPLLPQVTWRTWTVYQEGKQKN